MSLAKQFFELFDGLDRVHGTLKITGKDSKKGKVTGDYKMVHDGPSIDMWEKHLTGDRSLGIVPIKDDATCSFGAIDIDVYPANITDISEKIKEFGFPLIPCHTKSGGVHCYLFLKEPILANTVRAHLFEWATALGYPGVEVFPKQSNLAGPEDDGNFINMPYFGNTKRAHFDGMDLTAEEFIFLTDETRISEEALALIKVPVDARFEGAPPCIQYLVKNGFPEGSRNNALFDLGVYAKMRYGEFDFEDKVEDYNQDYMSPGKSKEVQNIIKSLRRKTYFYKCKEQPLSNYCNKELCRTREHGIGGSTSSEARCVEIDSLEKINSDKPVWIANVDGFRVQMDTSHLMDQGRFRTLCVERINKLPTPMKKNDWDERINTLLDNCIIREPPEDVNLAGELMFYLEQFCTGNAQAKTKNDLLRGLPWTEDNRTYFRSADFKKYLDSNHIRQITMPKLYAVLNNIGVEHVLGGWNIKGRCVQLWHIQEFDKQNEEYDIPDIEGEEF